MSENPHCPQCGSALPAGELVGGLCSQCLLKLGLEVADNADIEPSTLEDPAQFDSRDLDRIGPYKLLEQIGEGGMGIVYFAEQREPIQRRVALKVIKPGMDTKEVIARFEAERQALALMAHPNIAKVLDAGSTEAGRPFFVMEFVQGAPITDYCDTHRLTTRERLELFIQVCGGVQHAHQKGVIHRDIKPTNVLVEIQGDRPHPKIIDFGVAKATQQRLTERTLFTEHGQLVGTPEYMSPEQAEMGGLDIDTRTDIYSLGVLLYELLVGAPPFDPIELRQAGYDEIRRRIRKEDPPKPSTRVSTLGEESEVAAQRRSTNPKALEQRLKGDLDWITLKALEKDRTRRYSSATELASDVRRHLEHEPVSASPPSAVYRIRKFAGRHRGGVAAALVIAALLVAGLVSTTGLYVRSERARTVAEQEALRNELEAKAIQAVLLEDEPSYIELARQALAMHRAALGEDNPELLVHLIRHLSILELSYLFKVPPPGAQMALDDWRSEILEVLMRGIESPTDDVVEALWMAVDSDLFESQDREQFLRSTLELMRDNYPEGHERLADTLASLAQTLADKASEAIARSDMDTAEASFRKALALEKEAHPEAKTDIARREWELGRLLKTLKRFPEAEEMLLRSHQTILTAKGAENAESQATLSALINLYEAWGKKENAEILRGRLPRLSVKSVRDLGPLSFGELTDRGRGFSSEFGDRSVWVFSNATVIQDEWRSSAWSWTEDSWAADGLTTFHDSVDERGLPAVLIPLTEEEARFNSDRLASHCQNDCDKVWVVEPGPVLRYTDNDDGKTLIFFQKRLLNRRNFLDSQTAGSSIALWPSPERPAVRPTPRPDAADPTLLFPAPEPELGSAALIVGDDLFAYACSCANWKCPCVIGRAPASQALDRRSWRFYGGSGSWTEDWRSARPILDAALGFTVHWNRHLRRYLAAYTVPLDGKTIAIRSAPSPEGPWSDIQVQFETLRPVEENGWNVAGLAHPELSGVDDRVQYFTYRRATGFLSGQFHLLEVTFN